MSIDKDRATHTVTLYYTKRHLDELDNEVKRLGMRRNEYIKEAVREKLRKEKPRVATVAKGV